jgi:hypothetical protein
MSYYLPPSVVPVSVSGGVREESLEDSDRLPLRARPDSAPPRRPLIHLLSIFQPAALELLDDVMLLIATSPHSKAFLRGWQGLRGW